MSVFAHSSHRDVPAKDRKGRELFRRLAVRVSLLRAIIAVEPDAFGLARVEYRNRVAIRDAHHLPGKAAATMAEVRATNTRQTRTKANRRSV
jgi:hypothetical protein